MNLIRNLFAVFLICVFLAHPLEAFAGSVHGVFRVVKGQVSVKDNKGKVKKARLGGKVYPNDTIITSKDSRAKIIMVDKNVINVSPDSEILIEKYEYEPDKKKKNVLINVLYGKVRSKVNQKYNGDSNKFQVKTPSAVAGVRGTDFFTSFNMRTRATQVVTFEGEVRYGIPGANGSIRNAVSVRAGQMAQNTPGAPPTAPVKVAKGDLKKFDSESDAEKFESPSQRQPADRGGERSDDQSVDDKQEGAASEGPDGAAGETQEPQDGAAAGEDKGEPQKEAREENASSEKEKAPQSASDEPKKEGGGQKSAENSKGEGSGGPVASGETSSSNGSGSGEKRAPASAPPSESRQPTTVSDSGSSNPFGPDARDLPTAPNEGVGPGPLGPPTPPIFVPPQTPQDIVNLINNNDQIRGVIEDRNSRVIINITNGGTAP